MKEYLIRVGDDGMVTVLQEVSDLKQFDSKEDMFAELEADEPEGCCDIGQCADVADLEAVMVAMVKSIRDENARMKDEIIMLGKRVADLEKRPIATSEPLLYREYPGSPTWSRPWWDTITVTCNKI